MVSSGIKQREDGIACLKRVGEHDVVENDVGKTSQQNHVPASRRVGNIGGCAGLDEFGFPIRQSRRSRYRSSHINQANIEAVLLKSFFFFSHPERRIAAADTRVDG